MLFKVETRLSRFCLNPYPAVAPLFIVPLLSVVTAETAEAADWNFDSGEGRDREVILPDIAGFDSNLVIVDGG